MADAQPGVTAPIVGATKAAHVDDAVAAEALELTAEEVSRLEEPYVPARGVGARVAAVWRTGTAGYTES